VRHGQCPAERDGLTRVSEAAWGCVRSPYCRSSLSDRGGGDPGPHCNYRGYCISNLKLFDGSIEIFSENTIYDTVVIYYRKFIIL
jgi:hypothetical protein